MKLYFVAFFLIVISRSATAQSDVATAKWKNNVAADGKLREWQQPLSFYDSDTRLFFDIANDSSYLYLCFISADEMGSMKLMQAGMKITLTTKGKPKHEASVQYPLPAGGSSQHKTGNHAAPAENGSAANEPFIQDAASFRHNFLQHHTTMNIAGFASPDGTVPLTNASGIAAALNWDSASHLGYEIAIPKTEFFGKTYTQSDEAGEITLHVEIGALPRSSLGTDSKNVSNHSAGLHDGNAKEGGENGGLENDASRVDLSSKTAFKQKFVLSKPAASPDNGTR